MPPNPNLTPQLSPEETTTSFLPPVLKSQQQQQQQQPPEPLSDRTPSTSSSCGADSSSSPPLGVRGSSGSSTGFLDTIDQPVMIVGGPPSNLLHEAGSSEISDDNNSATSGKRRSPSDIPKSVDTAANSQAGYPPYNSSGFHPPYAGYPSQHSNHRPTNYGAITGSTPPRPNNRKRAGSYGGERQHRNHRRSNSEAQVLLMQQQQQFSPHAEARKLMGPSSSSSSHRRKHSWSSARSADTDSVGSAAGEAAFGLQQPQRRGSHRRQHSDRSARSQRRQQSVQLVMDEVKGVEQPMVCRNVVFLLLFVFHLLLVMAAAGRLYGDASTTITPSSSLDDDATTTTTTAPTTLSSLFYYTNSTPPHPNFLTLTLASGGVSALLSYLCVVYWAVAPRQGLAVMLYSTIAASFFWGTIGVGLYSHTAVPITGFIALALAIAYAFIVWDRLPLAAATVQTGCVAARSNHGSLLSIALGAQLVAWVGGVWYMVLVWSVVKDVWGSAPAIAPDMVPWVFGALGFSMYWTFQVLQGVLQAITAGVVGGT